MNKTFAYVLTAIVIILSLSVGLLIFQNQKLIKKLEVSESPTSTISQEEANTKKDQTLDSPSPTPIDINKQIEASLNSGNHAALGSYMTSPVNFILMSTECCGEMTQDEAVAQLDYIKEGQPFDFNQEKSLVKNLKAKNPQLAGTFIGISKKGEQLAAFTIDSKGKISKIQLSISYKLYNQ